MFEFKHNFNQKFKISRTKFTISYITLSFFWEGKLQSVISQINVNFNL